MKPLLRVSQHVTSALCLIAPFLFVLCLPWNDFGLWRQVEGANVALHALSCFVGLTLAARVMLGDRPAYAAVRHPVVIVSAALFGLGCMFMPLSGDAALSFYGLPKHGMGALWFLDLAVMTAGYLSLPPRILPYTVATAVVSLVAIAERTSHGVDAAPFSFPEYIAFIGLFAGIALSCLMKRLSLAVLSFAAVMGGALAFAQNKSAIAFALACVLVAAIGFLVSKTTGRPVLTAMQSNRFRNATASALAGAALFWVAIMPVAGNVIQKATLADVHQPVQVASASPGDRVNIPWIPLVGTVWERTQMDKVVLLGMEQHPLRFIVGAGWGSFPEYVAENQNAVAGRHFFEDVPTAARTFWDAQEKADFHSHNLFLEALASEGVLGLLLMIALCVSPVLYADKDKRGRAIVLSGGLVTIGSFWFLLPICTPFLAMAFAALGGKKSENSVAPLGSRASFGAFLTLAAMSQLFASSMMMGAARAEWETRHFSPSLPVIAANCSGVSAPFIPEKQINSDLYNALLDYASKQKEEGIQGFLSSRANNLRDASCTLRQYNQTGNSAYLLGLSLHNRGKIAALPNVPKLAMLAVHPDLYYWHDDIIQMLKIAPGRTDVVLDYVEWTAGMRATSYLDGLRPILSQMPPNDPSRLWAMGRIEQVEGDNSAAARDLNAALDAGVANYLPLSTEVVEAIHAMKAAGETSK